MTAKNPTVSRDTKALPVSPPDDAPLIDWALWHCDHGEVIGGYWITPLRPGEKKAYQANWSKEPLKTRAAVERHWQAYPNDNIGLVPRPGYFWLDTDDLDVLDALEEKHGRLPNVYTQRSINGSLHFLFQGDVSGSPQVHYEGKKLGEIRGALSGQCVGAGSRGKTRKGEPGSWKIEELAPPIVAPDWLFDLIKSSGKATLGDARKNYGEPTDWDEQQAKRLVEAVESGKLVKTYEGPFAEGERDNLTFQLFATAKNRMIHPDAMLAAVLDSGIAGGLEDDVVERKMRSAYHDGNTQDGYGSSVLAYWLPNYVFKAYVDGKPIDRPPIDPVAWKAANLEKLPKAFPGDPAPTPPCGNPERYLELVRYFEGVLSASGERKRVGNLWRDVANAPPLPWIIPGWLPLNSVVILYGESGAFKTYIAVNMANRIATGTPWAAHEGFTGYLVGEPSDVALFLGEAPDDVKRRIKADIVGTDLDEEIVGQRLLFVPTVYALNHADGLAGMADEIERLGLRPKVIVVDTFNLALDGNEDSAEEIKKAIHGLRALATMFGAAVVLIDHTGHGAKDRPRGSSAKKANADGMIFCEGDEETRQVDLSQEKNRGDGKGKYRASFEGRVIDLGDGGVPNLAFHAVKPRGNTTSAGELSRAKAEAKIMLETVTRAVMKRLKANPIKAWSQKALADAVATDDAVGLSSSRLRQHTLTLLREDKSSSVRHCYDPETARWRYVEKLTA
jgi:hypothetical protein